VPNAEQAYAVAVERGARGVSEPEWLEDEYGRVQVASISTYGEVVHTFVARADYAGPHLPGYAAVEANGAEPVGFTLLDHCVGNVELGKMDEWVGFMSACFELRTSSTTTMTRSTPSTRR
jgi:4-hydroxyphenylpyruvate dioxygenase